MKQKTLLKTILLLCALIVGSGSVWAETSTLTFTAACGGTGTADDDASWTVTSDAAESTYDGTRGIHYGTSSKAVSYLQLKTSDIPGTITEIIVNASGASDTSAKLNVTVGGDAFGSEKSLTSSAANYTLTGSASGEIIVRLSQTSATKALYVKKIEVTYSVNGSTTETLTFDVSSNPGNWPTSNSTTLTNYTYTLNNENYTFGLKNVKCNSGYLMMTSTAALGLPAIEGKKLTKVVAKNSSGCSTSTRVGVSSSSSSASYIPGGAYKTWSSTSSSYTYTLTSTEANTVYYLYVTNANAQVIELRLSYEPVADSHTLTSNVNPAEAGTVTLGSSTVAEGSSTTILATPNDGYRFLNWSVAGTGSSVSSTTSASTTFTMGTADATVTANFESIPTRIISVTSPSGGMVTVKDGEDVISSGSSVREGKVLTIIATPSAGKKFHNWSVTGATPASSTAAETTFTVGGNNVSIAATFEDATTYPVHWSVNGVVISTDNVVEGEAITFSAPASGIPAGYTFTGWSALQILTPQNSAPTYTTSATSTAEVTYYAVFANTSPTSTTATLTANSSWSSYAEKTFTDDKGNTWTGYCTGQNTSGTYNYGLNSNSKNYNIGSPAFSGNVTAISMKVANGSGSEARTVYICSSNATAQPSSGDIASLSVPKSSTYSTERSIDLTNAPTFSQFYIYVSAALSFSEIKVTYNNTVYSNFRTVIPEITVSNNTIEATAAETDGTLNVTYKAIVKNNTDDIAIEWYEDETCANTTTAPAWILTDINSSYNLDYTIGANTGAARTAYMKVFGEGTDGNFVFSELITISQAAGTVTAQVGAKGYATFVSDKALDFTGKSIKAYTISSTDGSALTLTQKNLVAANEPVLLYSETNSDSQNIPVIATATADSNNKLVQGTGNAITWSESNKVYVLNTTNTPGFYRANESPVATNKAYLDLTGVNASRSFFTLDFDGETQGIANINENENENRYFDLQGRRVATPQKGGLYIVNGKKVVVK